MTIASRFEEALESLGTSELEGPELLPTRLARAVVLTLPVDGAGLSLLDPARNRIPLGASDDTAACAERLQFTAGDGPCTTAHECREPVFATLDDMHRRWPSFAELLAEHTPYRGAVALPLPPSLSGLGALDLLFEDPAAVPKVDVFDAMALTELITSRLSEAAVWSTWGPDRGPDWLHGPPAQRRAAVWEAMGSVCLALGVDSPAALGVLRAAAYAAGSSVDDVARDLLDGRLRLQDLRRFSR